MYDMFSVKWYDFKNAIEGAITTKSKRPVHPMYLLDDNTRILRAKLNLQDRDVISRWVNRIQELVDHNEYSLVRVSGPTEWGETLIECEIVLA